MNSALPTITLIHTEKELSVLKQKKSVEVRDILTTQVKELYLIDNPQLATSNKEGIYATSEFTRYLKNKSNNYTYIYFPWLNSVVKSVEQSDFVRLKTSRNRDLITLAEQQKLYRAKVAVFGMSVGSNIALILSQAGISENIIIADHDSLDTTNMNRILAGIHEVGIEKTTIIARKLYEGNPYNKVTILPEGINTSNLEKLLQNKEIEYIVEEIDNILLKIDIRKLARKYKVPVVMITDNGDGIVLHVERYDLGYAKIFGKSDVYYSKLIPAVKSRKDIVNIIINDIVGGESNVDPRMMISVHKVLNSELVSWSQLGSAAVLGGVVATYALKEIILGRNRNKYIVSYVRSQNFLK